MTVTLCNYVLLSSGLLRVTYFGRVIILECSGMFACVRVGEEREKWGRLEVSSVIGPFSVVIQTGEVLFGITDLVGTEMSKLSLLTLRPGGTFFCQDVFLHKASAFHGGKCSDLPCFAIVTAIRISTLPQTYIGLTGLIFRPVEAVRRPQGHTVSGEMEHAHTICGS